MKKQQGGKRNFPAGRLLAALLSLCLLIGLMPGAQITAFADGGDKAIMPGVAGLSDPTPTTNDQGTYYSPSGYIFFGTNGGTPIRWQVLDADKANDKSTPAMFLLSENLVAKVIFEEEGQSDDGDGQTYPNEWQHSDAQKWCRDFASNSSNFSALEQSLMLGIAKTDVAESSLYDVNWAESRLTTDDKMFFLSVRELAEYVGDYNGAPGQWVPFYDGVATWWLRSPSTVNGMIHGGYVDGYGVHAGLAFVENKNGARPAFNLDLNSVLFTSAAKNGKPDGGLQPISDQTGNEWKLTLKDSSRNSFTIVNVQRIEDAVTVYYNGAKAGANEYVSALIMDDTGAYTHYGRLAQVGASAGMATFTLPELAEGSKVYIFNEQYNGDDKTDYAGDLVELVIPADGAQDGRQVELRTNEQTRQIQWRYVGEDDSAWRDLVALDVITGADGADGREVELQVDNAGGYIQWRYTTGSDTGWKNLLPLSALKGESGEDGRQVELKNDGSNILWRYEGEGDDAWQTLVALSDITGADARKCSCRWRTDTSSGSTTATAPGRTSLNCPPCKA